MWDDGNRTTAWLTQFGIVRCLASLTPVGDKQICRYLAAHLWRLGWPPSSFSWGPATLLIPLYLEIQTSSDCLEDGCDGFVLGRAKRTLFWSFIPAFGYTTLLLTKNVLKTELKTFPKIALIWAKTVTL